MQELPRQEMERLAIGLGAIGGWLQDTMCHETPTSKTLLRSAYWLKEAARNTCAGGIVECRGGDECTSDHK